MCAFMSVCLSVCVSARISLESHVQILYEIFCGRGSVLPRRRCDILCTSGFVDDVIVSCDGTYDASNASRDDVIWKWLCRDSMN